MEEDRNQDLSFWPPRPRVQAAAISAAVLLGAVVLYAFPPGESAYYPRCLIHAGSGLYCPGCGTARALHSALHGRLAEAADFNLWIFLLLPVLLAYGAMQAYSAIRYDRYRTVRRPLLIWAPLILAGLAYGVLRNLPTPSLAWLAP